MSIQGGLVRSSTHIFFSSIWRTFPCQGGSLCDLLSKVCREKKKKAVCEVTLRICISRHRLLSYFHLKWFYAQVECRKHLMYPNNPVESNINGISNLISAIFSCSAEEIRRDNIFLKKPAGKVSNISPHQNCKASCLKTSTQQNCFEAPTSFSPHGVMSMLIAINVFPEERSYWAPYLYFYATLSASFLCL